MQALWEFLVYLGRFEVFCAAAGLLFMLDLLAALPLFHVGFAKTEEHGYRPERRGYQLALGALWLLASLCLGFGSPLLRLGGTAFLFVVFRHYYIQRRWCSIRRGFGAPGFMAHWTVLYLLIWQLSLMLDASGQLASKAVLVARIDFAVIMLCAGTYKYLIGYAHNEGWEYGRVNPMWGNFWRRYRESNPGGAFVLFTNAMAFGMEILAGVLMLTEEFKVIGSLIISFSFLYIGFNIRLGRLAFLMTLLPVIYYPNFVPTMLAQSPAPLSCPNWLLDLLSTLMTGYILVLPLVKVSQYSNLFANQSLPEPLQSWITRYANWVPITIWRVFTPDLTNFFIRIYATDAQGEEQAVLTEETYGLSGWSQPRLKLRFLHVSESIAITSVFTTLKYFASNRALFDGKLLTYARSLQHDMSKPAPHFRFEYVALIKAKRHFVFETVGNFLVDLPEGTVREEKTVASFDFSAPAKYSPVRESVAPGSYLPKATWAPPT